MSVTVEKTVEFEVTAGDVRITWDSGTREVCAGYCRTEDIEDTIACLTALKNQIDSLEEDNTNG